MARDIETGPGTPTTASVVDPAGAQSNKDRQTGGVVEDAKVEAKGGVSGGVATGVASAPGQHLSWRVEEYSTHAGAWGRGPAVRVLHEISKTSLLECLSLRISSFTGALHVDGRAVAGDYFDIMGLVPKEDLFLPSLTVRQHLRFHALMRDARPRPAGDKGEEADALVTTVLSQVLLSKKADCIITDVGLSASERKRLSIGTELLSRPSILLLDEPTTALDMRDGEVICRLLRDLGRDGMVVMASLSGRPTPATWDCFTHLLLMSPQAGVAYHGSTAGLEAFLSSHHQQQRPKDMHIADFALSLVSPSDLDGGEEGAEAKAVVDKLCRAQKEAASRLPQIENDDTHKRLNPSFTRHPPFGTAIARNVGRFRQMLANQGHPQWQQSPARLFVACNTVGLLLGLIYWRMAPHSWQARLGLVFVLVVSLQLMGLGYLSSVLAREYPVFLREHRAAANSMVPFMWAHCVLDMPRLAMVSLTVLLPYGMAGLDDEHPLVFVRYFFSLVAVVHASVSLGYLGVSLWPQQGVAASLALAVPQIIFSPLLYDRSQLPALLSWIPRLSIVYHGVTAIMADLCPHADAAPGCGESLSFLRLDSDGVLMHIIQLLILMLAYRFLALGIYALRVQLERR